MTCGVGQGINLHRNPGISGTRLDCRNYDRLSISWHQNIFSGYFSCQIYYTSVTGIYCFSLYLSIRDTTISTTPVRSSVHVSVLC